MLEERFRGTVPENYDRYLGPVLFEDYAADLANRVAAQAPGRVLELAAGTGIVTRKLRDALPAGTGIVATDLNEPMLDIAAAKFGTGEDVRFVQADATQLDFEDASFDAVVCQFGVMFFPDKAQSYAEAHRVLKPGGRYVFNVWDAIDKNPFAKVAIEVGDGIFHDDPPAFYVVPFHYHDTDQIRSDLLAAGFDRVEIERVEITCEPVDVGDFARGLVFGNPLAEEILARGGDPEAVYEVVAEAVRDRVGSKIELSAFVVEATKRAA